MGYQSHVSGVILAGGMSRRLGRQKALEPLGGEPMIARVIGRLSPVVDSLVVVVNDEARASALPLPDSARVAVDRYPGAGPLGGILTGLAASEGEWAVVVSCDMPFLSGPLFDHMLGLRAGHDAVVPLIGGRPEPTHSVYAKSCLPHMERKIVAGDLKIASFFDDVRVNFVPEEVLKKLDAEMLSFFNVNTQRDLDRALALVAEGL